MSSSRRSRRSSPLDSRRCAAFFLATAALILFAPEIPSADEASPIERSLEFVLEGDYKAAKKLLEDRLKSNPGDAGAHIALAQIFLIEDEKADKATEHAEEAVRLDDESAEHHLWLARALARQATKSDRLEDAAPIAKRGFKEYERALSLNPAEVDGRGEVFGFYLAHLTGQAEIWTRRRGTQRPCWHTGRWADMRCWRCTTKPVTERERVESISRAWRPRIQQARQAKRSVGSWCKDRRTTRQLGSTGRSLRGIRATCWRPTDSAGPCLPAGRTWMRP